MLHSNSESLEDVYVLMRDIFSQEKDNGILFNYHTSDANKNRITVLITDEMLSKTNSDKIDHPVGIWTFKPDGEPNSQTMEKSIRYKLVLNRKNSSANIFLLDGGKDREVNLHLVPFQTDFLSRVRGVFDTSLLDGKTVAFIGVGSMGSFISLELVKSGVNSFILVDPDIFEVHNICRHTCGLSDVGRPKVDAVKDLILDKNPCASVVAIKDAFTISNQVLCDALESASLIVVTTDVDVAKREVNMFCVQNKIPAIYAGVFERAFGGEVVRYVPDVTTCYSCVLGFKRQLEEKVPSGTLLVDYSVIDDPNKVVAEPGLSIDLGFVNLITAKVCLETLKGRWLLKGDDEDEPPEIIFWGNKRDWIFNGTFDYVPAKTTLGPYSCDICDPLYYENRLQMTQEEIREEIEKSPTLSKALRKVRGEENE